MRRIVSELRCPSYIDRDSKRNCSIRVLGSSPYFRVTIPQDTRCISSMATAYFDAVPHGHNVSRLPTYSAFVVGSCFKEDQTQALRSPPRRFACSLVCFFIERPIVLRLVRLQISPSRAISHR